MHTPLPTATRILPLLVLLATTSVSAQSQLEIALSEMYRTCLFPNDARFSAARNVATDYLAPGLSTFIESNIASIPIGSTPPTLTPVFDAATGQITSAVSDFAPFYTESSATVGKGRFYAGTSFSYFNLDKLRGIDLNSLEFRFAQNPGGSDVIIAQMPLNLDAEVFTFYGTYGVGDRLDIGIAVPFIRLTTGRRSTTFQIIGDDTGLRYGGFSRAAEYRYTEEVQIDLPGRDPQYPGFPSVQHTEAYVSTLALRAKYRFPSDMEGGSVGALVDLRIPVGRSDSNVLGDGSFGARVLLVNEYDLGTFRPYFNFGGQYWNKEGASNLAYAGGFNQKLGPEFFFVFDLLGTIALEGNQMLNQIDELNVQTTNDLQFVPLSNIRALDRDHTLNLSLGFRLVLSSTFHLYGNTFFSLIDAGLQSTAAPTLGVVALF